MVYICYDHKYKIPVAIKGFKEEYALDETVIKLFEREAREWTELEKHQNIVRAEYVAELEGRPYIFLEYISGKEKVGPSLRHWLEFGEINPKDIKQILSLATQIANGMAYAYKKRKLIHRDLNPNNILITSDGVAKVTDFGLAKAIGETGGASFISALPQKETSASILEGNACGSPPYMPPEQWQGIDKTDTRSDIYSFGCILYEMLSGKPPFGFTGNLKQAQLMNNPQSLSSLGSSVPRELDSLILKCLEKNPKDRYQNFESLRNELARMYESYFQEKLTLEYIGPALEARELSNKGVSLSNLGFNQEAIECYNQAIELNPRDAGVYSNRGVSYHELGNLNQAISDCNKAIELNPRYAEAYDNRGHAYSDLGSLNQAMSDYNKAIELNPRLAAAYVNRGIAYARLGNLNQAISDFNQAIELKSRDPLVYNNRGLAHYDLGNFNQAISDHNKAIELNPGYAKAYLGRGAVYAELGNLNQATSDFNQAIELDPRLAATAYLSRGLVYAKLGNLKQAISDYNKAIEIDPRLATAYSSRGLAYADLGNLNQAISDFQKFIELAPPQYASLVEQFKEKIRELRGA